MARTNWIAQHALDWLSTQEKQFLTNNLASYLYGTELPDNAQAPNGVGDTSKHHVYFYLNGPLQDDASAVRARQEFAIAQALFEKGNFSGAAEHLGMVTHYVADVAVFGHVMGASTAWGAENHHSDYEDYVLAQTNTYQSGFGVYLVFDGALSSISAYDAAAAVGRDTTFDGGGLLTAVWMDQHYSWSNSTFTNRAGESLNIATNAVADVLHTFYVETVTLSPTPSTTTPATSTPSPVIPEFPLNTTLLVVIVLFSAVSVLWRKTSTLK